MRYRLQRHDGTDCSATMVPITVLRMVPIQRYRQRIIIRAYHDHIPYMKSLPLHASQRLLEEHDEYADFEVYLAPTYDFIMRLLHTGAMIEVISPASLRQTMKEWISDMYELYKND